MNKKIKNKKQFIAKHNELFFLIIFCIIVFGITIHIKTKPEDELWNFQNIYKMYNGYKIYVDTNVITTPLFHIIGVTIFKLFGANFLVFKLYGVVINILIFIGSYKIFKDLKIPKLLSTFLSMILLIAEINVCHNTANYNNLCLAFVVYGVLICIEREKISNIKFILLQIIISFLILFTKQNIGILYLISLTIYNLLFEKDHRFKNIFKIFAVNLILGIISLIMMKQLGVLDGFINYAILGIKEFALKNISIGGPIIELIGITGVVLIGIIVFNKKDIIDDSKIKNINIITCYAFPFLIVSYPIFNVSHIDLSLFFVYIVLIYMIYLVLDNVGYNRNIIYKITVFLVVLLGIISITRIVIYFYKINNDDYEYNNLYFGSLVSAETKYKIDDIINYMNESKENVIMVSTESAFYMMPLNRNNGNLDLPLLGNFGKEGEVGVVKQVSEMCNTKILINKEKKVYQESDMVIQYIKDNLVYIGEMYDFMIYRTKK